MSVNRSHYKLVLMVAQRFCSGIEGDKLLQSVCIAVTSHYKQEKSRINNEQLFNIYAAFCLADLILFVKCRFVSGEQANKPIAVFAQFVRQRQQRRCYHQC